MRSIFLVTVIKSAINLTKYRLKCSKTQQAMLLCLVCSLLVVACRPTEHPVDSSPITTLPTLTLIAIPPTSTPVPPTSTPVPPPQPSLLSPSDLLTPVPQSQETILSQLVLDDLDISEADVMLVEARQWRSAETLDCDREVGTSARSGRIAGYEVIVQSDDTVYIYHTNDDDHIKQCQAIALAELPAHILIMIDPLAGELAHIAQRDLAQRLGLHQNRVKLASMTLEIWEDSRLGCIRDHQEYVPMNINGYLITLDVQSVHYHYHTDSDRVLPCFELETPN